jgi:hypothetical protein
MTTAMFGEGCQSFPTYAEHSIRTEQLLSFAQLHKQGHTEQHAQSVEEHTKYDIYAPVDSGIAKLDRL